MRRRLRRAAAPAVLAVTGMLVASAIAGAAGGNRAADNPVRITATFDADATLGRSTAVELALQLDPTRVTTASPTEVRLAYPRSLGVVSSGLGIATCTRPASDFAKVLITGSRLGGCPPNSVMGYGTALAIIRLRDGQVIPEYAGVTLLSGPIADGRLGLVVYIDGQRPFGGKLAFAGEVRGAGGPYGGAITVRMPSIPGIEETATVSLVDLRIAIGSDQIRYWEHSHGQLLPYRPEGIVLPARCPRAGFPFRAEVIFADGSRHVARSNTPCPPRAAAPVRGR